MNDGNWNSTDDSEPENATMVLACIGRWNAMMLGWYLKDRGVVECGLTGYSVQWFRVNQWMPAPKWSGMPEEDTDA